MLKQFGEYILAGRQRAAIYALLFNFIPLLGWISSVIIGLVTLRKGPWEGLWIVLWASVVDIIAAFFGYPDALLFGILGGSILIWVISWVLWLTASWTMVLEATLLIGVITILGLHLFMPDIATWWLVKYQSFTHQAYSEVAWLAQSLGFSNEEEWLNFLKVIKESNALNIIAKVSTGTITALILGVRVIKLILARYWQAVVFYPAGFKPELYAARLGYSAVIGLILVLLGLVSSIELAWDLLPVFVLIFLLAGLSLTHYIAAKIKAGWIVLFIVYVLLILLTPYCALALMIAALGDSVLNIRQRVAVIKK